MHDNQVPFATPSRFVYSRRPEPLLHFGQCLNSTILILFNLSEVGVFTLVTEDVRILNTR